MKISTRYFICDEDGGCNNSTLTAKTINNSVHLHCEHCGYTAAVSAPAPLTNPNGSASFIGSIPAGHCL